MRSTARPATATRIYTRGVAAPPRHPHASPEDPVRRHQPGRALGVARPPLRRTGKSVLAAPARRGAHAGGHPRARGSPARRLRLRADEPRRATHAQRLGPAAHRARARSQGAAREDRPARARGRRAGRHHALSARRGRRRRARSRSQARATRRRAPVRRAEPERAQRLVSRIPVEAGVVRGTRRVCASWIAYGVAARSAASAVLRLPATSPHARASFAWFICISCISSTLSAPWIIATSSCVSPDARIHAWSGPE
jgi:hypothetical protein